MKKQNKILVFLSALLICLLLAPVAEAIQFSNMIVFGDSLSDIGNVPENQAFYHDLTKPATLSNLETNFYVPVANPVNPAGYTISFIPYHLPNFVLHNAPYLPVQPKLDNVERSNRSIIWNELFLSDAYQAGITKSQNLIPWANLETAQPPIPNSTLYSVNYAWVGAISDQGCFNDDWQPQSICTKSAILAARKNYLEHRTDANYKKELLPGLLTQEQLLIQDIQAHKVSVDKNTLYTLWIGGNDMSNDFNHLEHGALKDRITALKKLVFSTSWHVFQALKVLHTTPDIQAKHIYVFNIFDPSLLPRIHQWNKTLQLLGKGFVDVYNTGLQLDINMISTLYPQTSVHIVPVHTWTLQMAKAQGIYKSLGFDKHVGQACELSKPLSGSYLTPQTSLENCQGFMFWNSIHPAFPLEQILGYQLLQEVNQTFNAVGSNQAVNFTASEIATEQQQKALLKKSIDQKIDHILAGVAQNK